MRHDWFLDTRDRGGNSRSDHIRLDSEFRRYGELSGYTLTSQLVVGDGKEATTICLTAPDGRALNIVAHHDGDGYNDTVLANILSRTAALITRTPTPEQVPGCVAALDAVITTGLDCLEHNTSGAEALLRIRCAAEGIPLEVVEKWRTRIFGAGSRSARPTPREVSAWLKHGFTLDTACDWMAPLGDGVAMPGEFHLPRLAEFRRHGWTLADLKALEERVGSERVVTIGWAFLGPVHAELGIRAGLGVDEAQRLLDRDEWGVPTLQMLAGLRGSPDDPVVGA